MDLQKDIHEFIGAPRFTEDIDFLIQISPENANRLIKVIEAFGFGDLDIKREDFLQPEFVIQLGLPPNRIDILTSIDGVSWSEVWASKESFDLDRLPIYVIGKDALIKNKLASGRTKDKADAERLAI